MYSGRRSSSFKMRKTLPSRADAPSFPLPEIGLFVDGQMVMDDILHLGDAQSARCKIGADQNQTAAVAEADERLFTVTTVPFLHGNIRWESSGNGDNRIRVPPIRDGCRIRWRSCRPILPRRTFVIQLVRASEATAPPAPSACRLSDPCRSNNPDGSDLSSHKRWNIHGIRGGCPGCGGADRRAKY